MSVEKKKKGWEEANANKVCVVGGQSGDGARW